MSNVTIRSATPLELPIAADFWNAMVRESLNENWDEKYPNWRSLFVSAAERRMRIDEHNCFIAEVGDAIAGVAGAQIFESFFGSVRGYVDGVYVAPPFRRRGIGLRLITACNEWLHRKGCDVVRLQSTAAGRPLYEALGFIPTGEMELPLNPFKLSYAQTYLP
jgi:GNAT superfamily N-acetyltransferase